MTTKNRAAAAVLSIVAALTLAIIGPVAADAKVKDGPARIATVTDVDQVTVALLGPGQPPTPCHSLRYCPLGGTTL